MITALNKGLHHIAIEFDTGTNYEFPVYEAHLESMPGKKHVVSFDMAPAQAEGTQSDAGKDAEHLRTNRKAVVSIAVSDRQSVQILNATYGVLTPESVELEIVGLTYPTFEVTRIDQTPAQITFFVAATTM